mgnify:CR=1 FL=1
MARKRDYKLEYARRKEHAFSTYGVSPGQLTRIGKRLRTRYNWSVKEWRTILAHVGTNLPQITNLLARLNQTEFVAGRPLLNQRERNLLYNTLEDRFYPVMRAAYKH